MADTIKYLKDFFDVSYIAHHEREVSRTVAVVAVVCAAFVVLEVLLHLFLGRWLRQQFAKNPNLHASQLDITVGQCITRIIGAIHNGIQLPLAVVVLCDAALARNAVYGYTRLTVAMAAFTSGYFWHDLITCLRRSDGATYTLHAVCCLLVFNYALHTRFLHWYGAAFLMWEASTPFVHARWLLFKLGHADSKIYTWNGVAMLLAFFLARNVFGVYTSVQFWRDSTLELAHPREGGMPPAALWVYRGANVVLNGLNLYWLLKMLQGVAQLLVGRKGSTVGSHKDE